MHKSRMKPHAAHAAFAHPLYCFQHTVLSGCIFSPQWQTNVGWDGRGTAWHGEAGKQVLASLETNGNGAHESEGGSCGEKRAPVPGAGCEYSPTQLRDTRGLTTTSSDVTVTGWAGMVIEPSTSLRLVYMGVASIGSESGIFFTDPGKRKTKENKRFKRIPRIGFSPHHALTTQDVSHSQGGGIEAFVLQEFAKRIRHRRGGSEDPVREWMILEVAQRSVQTIFANSV
ncbi:hypothetical protein K438DRAFT_1783333 [Mycena galopus ATCC 62051]|nr:hypothetical protein K438DRAFT_1783333 [Mycena galopus ATCC 62051]